MQTLTNKELNYIADSISNEELLLKQCAAAAAASANPTVQNHCINQLRTHEQHLHTLMNVLQQNQGSNQQQFGGMQPSGMQQH
ncbi:MAG: hypothetical protein K0R57_4900 [Paenibacillaceae bacterium]|jgi:hypothetical protein|nr:hypothetical protein [Paenibacillaceae bacterium]